MPTLSGKTAIVTGVGNPTSIGAGYAKALAEEGASVVIADVNELGARAVADALTAAGNDVVATSVDITDEGSVARMVAVATERFGGVDILVNNAALMVELTRSTLLDYSLDEWRRVFDVNLTGAYLCIRAAVPSMRQRGGGKIVNQSSGGAFPPAIGNAYGISKLALVGLTVALAKELGPDNINVNAIAPGFTASASGLTLVPEGSPLRERFEQNTSLRAQGSTDDLVGALLLLTTPAGDWITGQTLNVDGGWIMRI